MSPSTEMSIFQLQEEVKKIELIVETLPIGNYIRGSLQETKKNINQIIENLKNELTVSFL